MTRTWLLILGVLASVGFATIVLVGVPRALLREMKPSPGVVPYSETELRGRQVYIDNGCVYCHSQQLRDSAFTTDSLRGWGERASKPGDYVYDRPQLLGTMRTGPDLLNIGARLPDKNWHLIHLYAPRSVVPWSIMPGYPFLFDEKRPDEVTEDDVVVGVAGSYAPVGRTVVARAEALDLVTYLLSLKRGEGPPEPPPATSSVPEVDDDG